MEYIPYKLAKFALYWGSSAESISSKIYNGALSQC